MRRLPLSTENVLDGMAFLLLRLHISAPARDAAGSVRRKGSLDGRSRFVRFEYSRGEGAGRTRLLHFALKFRLLGLAFRCIEDPPRGPGFHPHSKCAFILPGAY